MCALFIVCIGLASAPKLETAGGSLVRRAGYYSLLAARAPGGRRAAAAAAWWSKPGPLAAAAVYGLVIDGVSPGGRLAVTTAVAPSSGVSLVAGQVRPPGSGGTLEATHDRPGPNHPPGARPASASAAPWTRYAPPASRPRPPSPGSPTPSLELSDAVLRGGEPSTEPLPDPVALRRVARQVRSYGLSRNGVGARGERGPPRRYRRPPASGRDPARYPGVRFR